jgi:hypothetical protein
MAARVDKETRQPATRHRKSRTRDMHVPDIIVEPRENRRYTKGRILGKVCISIITRQLLTRVVCQGGFARCYIFKSCQSSRLLAVKCIGKASLVKESAREKVRCGVSQFGSYPLTCVFTAQARD